MKYASEVTSLLEKSFANRNSFSKLYEITDYLVESVAKYSDYLEENLKAVNEYQSLEKPLEVTNITALPYQSDSSFSKLYSSKRERNIAETLEEQLASKIFIVSSI